VLTTLLIFFSFIVGLILLGGGILAAVRYGGDRLRTDLRMANTLALTIGLGLGLLGVAQTLRMLSVLLAKP
jgi:hypothetical protein